jgi:hypothetical protein
VKQKSLQLSRLDREIRLLFTSLNEPNAVLESLFDRIASQTLSVEDQQMITPFFLLSGANIQLLEVFREHLSYQKPIAWNCLVETLDLSGFKFNEAHARKIYSEAQQQDLLPILIKTKKLDSWLPELVSFRKNYIQNLKIEVLKKKSSLLQQADIYKSQDMDDQELDILKHLEAYAPSDPVIKQRMQDLKLRRSRKLLESKLNTELLNPHYDLGTVSSEDKEVQRKIFELIKERVLANSDDDELKYSYAIALAQLDLPNESLEILGYIKNLNLNYCWLKLHLLKNTEQYLKALEFLDDIEEMESQHGLSGSTEAQYERAIIYWKLNQKSKALILLEELAALNPDYRDVSILLQQWKVS